MIGRGVCRAGAAIRWDWLSLVWPLWGQGARVWDRARLARILGFRRDIGGGVGRDGGGQLQKALTQHEVGLEWRVQRTPGVRGDSSWHAPIAAPMRLRVEFFADNGFNIILCRHQNPLSHPGSGCKQNLSNNSFLLASKIMGRGVRTVIGKDGNGKGD